MNWDDEYGNMDYSSRREESIPDKNTEGELDAMDITNPVSAYFSLRDDAQDEIDGSDKKKMKCLSCGTLFIGELYDMCPECFSSDTEDVVDGKDRGYL